MSLIALLTPCAMLAVLWALQRLETWMSATPVARQHRGAARAEHPLRRSAGAVAPEVVGDPRAAH